MPDYPLITPEMGVLKRLAALEERVAALERKSIEFEVTETKDENPFYVLIDNKGAKPV